MGGMNLGDVRSVHVRLEGEVNRNWKVEMKDGSVHNFYSIEGSPEYEGGPLADFRVYDQDPDLAQFLEEVSDLQIPLVTEPEKSVVEFDYEPKLGYVTNIEIEVGKEDSEGLEFTGVMKEYPDQYMIRLGCIDSLELVNGQLVAKGKLEWDVENILHEMERRFGRKVCDWVKQQDPQWDPIGMPLSEWWGLGSEFLYNYGFKVKVEFDNTDFTVTVY